MTILVNFRMSEHLKVTFDAISEAKQIPKSYIMNMLVEKYVREEAPKLIQDKKNAKALCEGTLHFEEADCQLNERI